MHRGEHVTEMTLVRLAQSSNLQKHREESVEMFCGRLTHAGLGDSGIARMANLNRCPKLLSLHLYNNSIGRIENLQSCRQLTHLYLQHNQIERLEGIHTLTALTKLFVGHNCISVVEGLDKMTKLRELHIEYQQLPAGEKLLFDPRSIITISGSLKILNVAGNKLDQLDQLFRLYSLSSLNISANSIDDLREIVGMLHSCHELQKLWVKENPICQIHKYREELIVASMSVAELDGAEINAMQRQFLLNWKAVLDKKKTLALNPKRSKPRRKEDDSMMMGPDAAKFPSKFSTGNPHWLPPLATKTSKSSSHQLMLQ